MNRALALCLLAVGLSIVGPALANDTVYYYYNDAQGSPVAVTDASGNVIERTQYAPYGQVLNRPEHDGPGYTGHEEDAATGLTNMQQRYDDKALGRMLSTDPMDVDTSTGSNFNRYAYANDNPYRFTDPDGRCADGASCDSMVQSYGAFANANPEEADKIGSTVGVAGAVAMLSATGLSEAVGLAKGAVTVVKALNKAEQLSKNAQQGAKAEKAVANEMGDKVAGTHVTLESSTGQRSVADIVTKDKGVVEVKSGGAQLSSGQKAVKADIDAGRPVVPRGQNAEKAGLTPDQPVQMKCYDVKRC